MKIPFEKEFFGRAEKDGPIESLYTLTVKNEPEEPFFTDRQSEDGFEAVPCLEYGTEEINLSDFEYMPVQTYPVFYRSKSGKWYTNENVPDAVRKHWMTDIFEAAGGKADSFFSGYLYYENKKTGDSFLALYIS